MTDAELEALRAEYRSEYAAVSAWLDGQPYTGTWIPSLAGKSFSALAPEAQEQVRTILPPGLLFAIFETRVIGQHPEYPDDDVTLEDGTTVKKSAQAAQVKTQLESQLAALLG